MGITIINDVICYGWYIEDDYADDILSIDHTPLGRKWQKKSNKKLWHFIDCWGGVFKDKSFFGRVKELSIIKINKPETIKKAREEIKKFKKKTPTMKNQLLKIKEKLNLKLRGEPKVYFDKIAY